MDTPLGAAEEDPSSPSLDITKTRGHQQRFVVNKSLFINRFEELGVESNL